MTHFCQEGKVKSLNCNAKRRVSHQPGKAHRRACWNPSPEVRLPKQEVCDGLLGAANAGYTNRV